MSVLITAISNRRIWRIAYPIILGSIAQNLINVTDTAFLGRLGEVELGAGAIGGIFYLAIIMFGYGLGIGTQIIVARSEGEGRQGEIGKVMNHSFAGLLVTAIIMFGLIRYLSADPLAEIISSSHVYKASNEYLQLRAWGVFFAFINMGFNAFYIGTARTGIITLATVLMAIINIFLDYVLIFGVYGFPAMGIRGAAVASVCAEIAVSLFFIVYTAARRDLGGYRLFNMRMFRLHIWLRIAGISIPVMLQNFLSLAVWFIFFVFVERMGETQLAISNIIRSVYVILMIPIWGFAATSNTLVSYLIGQGRFAEVLPLIGKTALLCFLMVMVFVIFCILFPLEILGIYTNDPFLVNESVPVLYVVSGSVVCFAFAMVFFFGVSGTGKTNVALIIELVAVTLYLAAAYSLANIYKVGIATVWLVEFLYAIVLFALSLLYIIYGDWKTQGRII